MTMIEIISKEQKQYKANLHSHSTLSDGIFTPEQMKEEYKKRGYSILAITDHEVPFDHSAMNEKDFLMLTGYEVFIRTHQDASWTPNEPEMHFNLIAKEPDNVKYICYNKAYCPFIPEEKHALLNKVGSEKPREYSTEYIQEFLNTALKNGYLCLYNHPMWSLETIQTVMPLNGFLSMEMCNFGSLRAYMQEYNSGFYDALIRGGKSIACHGADDNHNWDPLDSPRNDSFGAFTMILSKDLTYKSVIDALETGNFYCSMGPIINALSFDGEKVHVETSDAIHIAFLGNGKSSQFVAGTKENPINQADFKISKNAPYFRITVTDENMCHADTRAYMVKDGKILPFVAPKPKD